MKKPPKLTLLLLLILTCFNSLAQPCKANTATHISKIVRGCKQYNFTKAQCAYTLATVEWETAGTFRPVKESFWLSENFRNSHYWYAPYWGRGYIQLTHKKNYYRMGRKLNIDLVNYPDLALREEIALQILFTGLRDGDFTGLRLSQFVINSLTFSRQARRVVNGNDKATHISNRAYVWLKLLTVY